MLALSGGDANACLLPPRSCDGSLSARKQQQPEEATQETLKSSPEDRTSTSLFFTFGLDAAGPQCIAGLAPSTMSDAPEAAPPSPPPLTNPPPPEVSNPNKPGR